MRSLLLALTLVLAPTATHAQSSISVRDMIELSKAGLSAEVLLALIEVHRPVFPIDNETLKLLKASGVAPAVIVAMVKSGRDLPSAVVEPPPPARLDPESPVISSAPAPEPQVVVIEREAAPQVLEVAVPVYGPVPTRRYRDRDHDGRKDPPRSSPPVYWGWGGKLRPDAWTPAGVTRKDDGKKDHERKEDGKKQEPPK